jgi:hypothetical protein
VAVIGTGAARSTAVSLYGTVGDSSDDEHVLNLVQITSATASTSPSPLWMNGRTVGGAGSGYQIGGSGGFGLNNVGLDVVIWGKVTGYDTDTDLWATVDDGAGRDSGMGTPGIKVQGPDLRNSRMAVGSYVRVQGSASLFKSGSTHYPVIRVATAADVTIIQVPAQSAQAASSKKH